MAGLVVILKALSSEPRLRILKALNGKRLCVNVIVKRLEMTPSAVSQHLRVLKNAGLVNAEKCGYWMHYTVNKAAMEKRRESITRLLSVKELPKKHKGKEVKRCPKRKKNA